LLFGDDKKSFVSLNSTCKHLFISFRRRQMVISQIVDFSLASKIDARLRLNPNEKRIRSVVWRESLKCDNHFRHLTSQPLPCTDIERHSFPPLLIDKKLSRCKGFHI